MEKQRNKKKYLMALCIIAPIMAMVMIMLNRSGAASLSSYLPFAMFLLCPLSHFLLMPLMHHTTGKEQDQGEGGNKPSYH